MTEELAKKEERNPSSESMIEFIDVHKWFAEFHVLQGIDLTVQRQERIVICGPSGSGKSTLIRCINRLEEQPKWGCYSSTLTFFPISTSWTI